MERYPNLFPDEFNEPYIKEREDLVKKESGRKHRAVPKKKGKLPPGQKPVPEMIAMPSIIDRYPLIMKRIWRLRVYGSVNNEMEWNWREFLRLGQKDYTVDFHCVTHWTKLGQSFRGIPFKEIVNVVRPKPEAKFVIFECVDGYTTNVPLQELLKNDSFVAVAMDGRDIEDRFGGPARAVIPHLYGWKSAKFLKAIRFEPEDEPGFWETRGYHNHGDPWKEERYAEDAPRSENKKKVYKIK